MFKKKFPVVLVFVLGSFLTLITFVDFKKKSVQKEDKVLEVEVTRSKYGQVEEFFETVGVLVPEKRVDIIAGVPGRIKQLIVKAGSKVKKDELIAVLTPESKIYAPFDSILGDWKVSVGQNVSVGTLLTEAVDSDILSIEYNLPEKYISKIDKNQKIDISVAAFPSKNFSGKLDFISPTVSRSSLTLLLRAVVDNKDFSLIPGMSCQIKHRLRVYDNAVLIPEQSLRFTMEGTEVFVVENGKIVRKEVKTGFRKSPYIQIIEGLKAGEVIITVHTSKIREGVSVSYAGGGCNAK